MSNPWLSIPLEDYEAHMRSDRVRQLDVLADLFAHALEWARPESVAILGVAGGNGLDRVDSAITSRILGFDVNPRYIEEVRRRHGGLPGVELRTVDLAREIVDLPPVRLVHAALIFEHAGLDRCLDNAESLVAPHGHLSVVLQLPSESAPVVGDSGCPIVQTLERDFTLIDRRRLSGLVEGRGFQLAHEQQRPLAGGKVFWMGIFARSG